MKGLPGSFFTFFTSSWLALALVLTDAQGQKPPVFKGGVDLLQLDVTVLDKAGKPVRGLKAADFTVLEDGQPQAVQSFAEIDLPDAVDSGPPWSREVSPDVTSNQFDNKRIFVLLLDDARGMGASLGRRELLRTGQLFIDALGPQDLAAIVYTQQVKLSQDLTGDRAKLSKSLQSYPIMDAGMMTQPTMDKPVRPRDQSDCLSRKESLRTMQAIVEHLATVPDRRKAVIYYGFNLPWAQVPSPSDDPCGVYWMWREILTASQQGHVSINPVDTGLRVRPVEYYMAVAENTGGHAVVGTNDLAPGLGRILVENSSYYLLAYRMRPGDPDGTYRRVVVKVSRPDVEVVTRRGYWTPRAKAADKPAEPPSPDIEALAGILPSSKLNLRATAAPFAVAGSGQSAIAIAVGVTQPPFATRAREVVDVLIKAYSVDGDDKGTESAVVPVTVPAARAGAADSRYDVLARIDVPKPGRYELRLVVHTTETDERGSVYVDVDVPDFVKAKLSMSGVVLSNPLSAVPVAPPRLLADLVPVTPIAERTYTRTDRVSAFLRIYQGGSGKLNQVPVTIRILDGTGAEALNQTDKIAVERFADGRAADLRFDLPIDRLAAGQYLLTFAATLDKVSVRRDVVFNVK